MTLLCIDDDPDDFLLLQEAIQITQIACNCIYAADGLNALDILKSFTPDLIFLDNNMPIMNGQETLRNIRQNALLNAVPIYMLSTYIGPTECEKFRTLGATGCLVKQPTFDAFCTTVLNAFKKHIH